MKRLVPLVLLLAMGGSLLILLGSKARPQLPWRRNYPQALAQAGRKDLPLLVYLYTDWCTFCARMERETFPDPELVADMAPRFIWVKLNAEKDPQGIRLREVQRVNSYPVFFILNSQAEEIDQVQGFMRPEKFRQQVDFLLHGPTSFRALKKQIERNPEDVAAHFGLGEKYLQRGDLEGASQHFREVLRRDPGNQQGKSDAALYYLALAEASAGLEQEALSTTQRLERLFPRSRYLPDCLILAGRIYYYGGNRLQAREIFSSYLDRFKEHRSHTWITQLLSEIEQEIRLSQDQSRR